MNKTYTANTERKEEKGKTNRHTSQKWSDMDQEETTHSIRVDGIKLRNNSISTDEREIIAGHGDNPIPDVTHEETGIDNEVPRPIQKKKNKEPTAIKYQKDMKAEIQEVRKRKHTHHTEQCLQCNNIEHQRNTVQNSTTDAK
jgi:hypothetical protein